MSPIPHSIVDTRSQASLFSTLSSGIVSSLVCRYLNEDFILKLPSEKKIRDLKWFSVYDLSTQVINCSVTSCITITYCYLNIDKLWGHLHPRGFRVPGLPDADGGVRGQVQRVLQARGGDGRQDHQDPRLHLRRQGRRRLLLCWRGAAAQQ